MNNFKTQPQAISPARVLCPWTGPEAGPALRSEPFPRSPPELWWSEPLARLLRPRSTVSVFRTRRITRPGHLPGESLFIYLDGQTDSMT